MATEETDGYSEWDQRNAPAGIRQRKTAEQRNDKATAAKAPLEAERSWEARRKSFWTRVFYSWVMVLSFAGVLAAGHFYCMVLIFCVSAGVYFEIISLKRNREKDARLPLFYFLRWYFFLLVGFYCSRLFIPAHIDKLITSTPSVSWLNFVFKKYHALISFALGVGGLVLFVLSLRKFTLRYQFHQFAWTVVTLGLLIIPALAMIASLYQGMMWFLLPTSLVITNDVFAYLVGFFFGRTPLISLSPKKTWEGFIGGSVFTLLWAVIFTKVLSWFPFLACPQEDLFQLPFSSLGMSCSAADLGLDKPMMMLSGAPAAVASAVGHPPYLEAVQLHGAVLALFASLIAPFGGFFASGFKRAFKIKDFGDVIPGHGGFTDRFDCQILMGGFTYLYVQNFVVQDAPTVETVVQLFEALDVESQKLALAAMQKIVGH